MNIDSAKGCLSIRASSRILAAAVLILGILVIARTVGAAYPGMNGKIVFGSDRDRGGGYDDLYVATLGVPGVLRLTYNTGEVWDVHPAWSPDGGRIVFARYDTHDYEIMVMNADGSNVVQLTNNEVDDFEPAWSPDGRKIAYTTWAVHEGGREDWDMWIMNPDGSGKRLLFDGGGYDMEPDWSPDGRRIALERDDEIWIIDADGSRPVRITNNSQYDSAPQWDPGGTQLAYTSVVAGNPEICTVEVASLKVTQLTFDAHPKWESCWSPDGDKILFQRNDDEDWEIVIMDRDGSDLVSLTDNTGWDLHPAWQRVLEAPSLEVDFLIERIRALIIKTELTRRAGWSLIEKLEVAKFYIIRDRVAPAARSLRSFIRQVISLDENGRIDPQDAGGIISGALTILAQVTAP